MTAARIANHADDVLAVLEAVAELLGEKGRPADKVIEVVRAAIAALIAEDAPGDPAAIRKLAADLRAEPAVLRGELAAKDNDADGDLDKKWDTGGEG